MIKFHFLVIVLYIQYVLYIITFHGLHFHIYLEGTKLAIICEDHGLIIEQTHCAYVVSLH